MDFGIKDNILAIVSLNRNVISSTTPIFYVNNEEEREELALLIAKVTMGMVHDLRNGTYVIVRH